MTLDIALAQFYKSLYNTHVAIINQEETTNNQQNIRDTASILQQELLKYNSIGKIVHSPEVFMTSSQFKYYMALTPETKTRINQLLEQINPTAHQKVIKAFQIFKFPINLQDEEASLYFAMHDGLLKLRNATTINLSFILLLRKAIFAFANISNYEALQYEVSKDVYIEANLVLYHEITMEVNKFLNHIVYGYEYDGTENKKNEILSVFARVNADVYIKQFGNARKSKKIKILREVISKLPNTYFKNYKQDSLRIIDSHKKEDFEKLFHRLFDLLLFELKDIVVCSMFLKATLTSTF